MEHDVRDAQNALDQLAIMLTSHAQLIRREPTLCLVMTGLSAEMEDDNPKFTEALHGVYMDFIGFIEGIIRSGQAKGEVRDDVDAKLIALNMVGLLRGIGCFGVLNDMGLDCEIVIHAVKPVLLEGLRPR